MTEIILHIGETYSIEGDYKLQNKKTHAILFPAPWEIVNPKIAIAIAIGIDIISDGITPIQINVIS